MECKECGFNATVEHIHAVRLEKMLKEIKGFVDCMNPKHCGCDRCPNCNIFYDKLVKKLSLLTKGEKR